MNNITKYANSANNEAIQIEFSSFVGGDDSEHNGVGFVEVFKIFALRGPFFFVTKPFV